MPGMKNERERPFGVARTKRKGLTRNITYFYIRLSGFMLKFFTTGEKNVIRKFRSFSRATQREPYLDKIDIQGIDK